MREQYAAFWANPKIRNRFATKNADCFFATEIELLNLIDLSRLDAVLDVGCAAGRFRELLTSMGFQGDFSGIDFVPENIETARSAYPNCQFYVGDFLTADIERRFDLVNATGVAQNEPKYRALINRMLALSKGYVMFDLKVAERTIDREDPGLAGCFIDDQAVPLVCLSESEFSGLLQDVPDVEAATVIRYRTPFNAETVVPDWLTHWDSVGVLLKKGPRDLGTPVPVIEIPRPADR